MKILVVQTAHLGDVLLAVPLMRALHAGGVSAITLLTTVTGRELLDGQPWLARVRVYAKRGGEGEGARRLTSSLSRERFDVAVAAQRSFRTGVFVRATRAPLRVGFAGAPGSWAYSERVAWDPGRHAVDRYLALAAPVLGPARQEPLSTIDVDPAVQDRVETTLAGRGVEGRRVAIAPGSRWGTKQWTPDGFAAVARGVAARGLQAVIVGSAGERGLCEDVARDAGGIPVLAGETTLPELAALLAGSRALVANDSGTAHLAAAVGTPVVSVFGPTAPSFGYVPHGVPCRVVEHTTLECRPCHRHGPPRCPLGHFRCMREIGADRVLAALDELCGRPE